MRALFSFFFCFPRHNKKRRVSSMHFPSRYAVTLDGVSDIIRVVEHELLGGFLRIRLIEIETSQVVRERSRGNSLALIYQTKHILAVAWAKLEYFLSSPVLDIVRVNHWTVLSITRLTRSCSSSQRRFGRRGLRCAKGS